MPTDIKESVLKYLKHKMKPEVREKTFYLSTREGAGFPPTRPPQTFLTPLTALYKI